MSPGAMALSSAGIRYQNVELSSFFHTKQPVLTGPKFDHKKIIDWTIDKSKNYSGEVPLTIDDYLYHDSSPLGVNWRSGAFLNREQLFLDEAHTYRAYFGILHGHTQSSDGLGHINDAYAKGRDVAKLDFLAITDHPEAWRIKGGADGTPWRIAHEVAVRESRPDFLGIPGFEYSSLVFGHFTVLNTKNYRDSVLDYNLSDFYSWLEKPDQKGAVVFFNHPGFHFYRRPFEFQHFAYRASLAETILGVEVLHRNSAYEYMRGYSQTTPYMDEALQQGWVLGSVGGQDNHRGTWGLQDSVRIAPLMSSLTQDNLWDAIRHRRFYATQIQDLQFVVEAKGYRSPWYPMGSRLFRDEVGERPIQVRVGFGDPSGTEVPRRLEIVSGGRVIATYSFSPDQMAGMHPPRRVDPADPEARQKQEKEKREVRFSEVDPYSLAGINEPHIYYPRAGEWRFELTRPQDGGLAYFYVRFYQGDEADGFTQSSPIWVE